MKWTLGLLLIAMFAGCVEEAPHPTPVAPSPDVFQVEHAISWAPQTPLPGDKVIFSLTTNIQPSALQWLYGDGTSGSKANHVYRSSGIFPVSVEYLTEEGKFTAHENLTVTATPTSKPVSPGTETPTKPVEVGPAKPEITEILWEQAPFLLEINGSKAKLVAKTAFGLNLVRWGDGTANQELTHTYPSNGEWPVTVFFNETLVSSTNATVEGYAPRVVVGMSDSGINPYHETYYRPFATQHPCTYVTGYNDCSIPALNLTVGPGGSYMDRIRADEAVWKAVKTGTWYWIPQTNIIAAHCPTPYTGDDPPSAYATPTCILDDTSTHGTETTSSMLSEAPDALLVFNEGSGDQHLAHAPVAIDIESNSWGSAAPLYAGYTHVAGVGVCNDSIESPNSIKFRSAGNNGPVPNMGDCWRNGYRTYSVGGGYPSGQHGYMSGSTPDFASYWCRPTAHPASITESRSPCGTSFSAPTAAGTAAAALLEIRRELDFVGGSTTTEVVPGISHEAFMDGVISAATYSPTLRQGFPSSNLLAYPIEPTPFLYWGWGWLHAEQVPQIVDCVMGRDCPDNKSAEAWAFNDARRDFAADS